MLGRSTGRLLGAAIVSVLASPGALAAPPPSYQHDVLPIFQKACTRCHGEKKTSAGIDLRTLAAVMSGGADGPVVKPGKPEDSTLWESIASDDMPKDGDPLTAAEKAIIRRWISEGQFPGTGGVKPAASSRRLWSLIPPQKSPVPAVRASARVRTPVDAFVLARLEQQKLSLGPATDRRALIRRVTFDLTGLPPTPEEVEDFVADRAPDAYERLVDRLLSSPRYGERWARHWLDVAGFAESSGFVTDDSDPRPDAWRYRDYVIRSLNADKPYDQFLVEQLAGDELSDWRKAESMPPEMADQLVATGFLRVAPDATDNQPMYQLDKRWDRLLASMEIALKATMGLTWNCARCHDHKFDPLTQADFYKLLAVFRPAYDPDNWIAENTKYGPKWPSRVVFMGGVEERRRREADMIEAPKRVEAAQKAQDRLRNEYRKRLWLSRVKDLTADERRVLGLPVSEWKKTEREIIGGLIARHAIDDKELETVFPEYKAAAATAKAKVEEAQAALKEAASRDKIWGLWDVSPEPAPSRILLRGDFNTPGDVVPPGIPAVFEDPARPLVFPPPDRERGTSLRRLTLARWLTRPDHPLTARVFVNRVWQQHFGRGIVHTPDDFGTQGARPTHPELLDWLAVWFVENGWSVKKLHRLILTSEVYRQSSRFDPTAARRDPANDLLWRFEPRRLEAEAIRDALLAVAGTLNVEMFGKPVKLVEGPDGQQLVKGDEPGRWRRSVYLKASRTKVLSFLRAFDAPEILTNEPHRFVSTVPTQSLALMNNPLMHEVADLFGDRLLRESRDRRARAERAFALAFGRKPQPAERDALLRITGAGRADDREAWALFAHSLLAANEFLYID